MAATGLCAASVLRQIYHRQHQGRAITAEERKVARDLLRAQDTDRDLLSLISRMAVLVARPLAPLTRNSKPRLPSSRPSTSSTSRL